MRDIKLWFGWGSILRYPTGPKDYLREMMKPDTRPRFLEQPRRKRKAILRFVIEENDRRSKAREADPGAFQRSHDTNTAAT
jgi:hypothetical protein